MKQQFYNGALCQHCNCECCKFHNGASCTEKCDKGHKFVNDHKCKKLVKCPGLNKKAMQK